MDETLKILVPVDFSRHSTESLKFAIKLKRYLPARFLVLHVTPFDDSDVYLPLPGPTGPDEATERRVAEAGAEIDRQIAVLREGDPGLDMVCLVRQGVPFREICRCAEEENVQLVVIGTHGRTGLSHLLIGSTAERVVQHASCPVLSVKPHVL